MAWFWTDADEDPHCRSAKPGVRRVTAQRTMALCTTAGHKILPPPITTACSAILPCLFLYEHSPPLTRLAGLACVGARAVTMLL